MFYHRALLVHLKQSLHPDMQPGILPLHLRFLFLKHINLLFLFHDLLLHQNLLIEALLILFLYLAKVVFGLVAVSNLFNHKFSKGVQSRYIFVNQCCPMDPISSGYQLQKNSTIAADSRYKLINNGQCVSSFHIVYQSIYLYKFPTLDLEQTAPPLYYIDKNIINTKIKFIVEQLYAFVLSLLLSIFSGQTKCTYCLAQKGTISLMLCFSLKPNIISNIQVFYDFYIHFAIISFHKFSYLFPFKIVENESVMICFCLYQMRPLQKLKSILEKDDTPQGLAQFKQILKDQESRIHNDQKSLLLRWAVVYQKKQFPSYYDFLSKSGANINFVDTKDYKSNLMIACDLKRQQIVETIANDKRTNFLLEDKTNKTALFYAINNKVRTAGEKHVRTLLQKCPELLTNPNLSKKNNALEIAISLMKVQIVKVLLEFGAKPNQYIDDKKNTSLHQAVRLMNNSKQKSHFQQIVQTLLDNGADPNQLNSQGKNAYYFADKCLKQFEQMCKRAQNKQNPQPQIKPILSIKNAQDAQNIFINAQNIFNKYRNLIQIHEQENIKQFEDGFDDDPFEPQQNFVYSLSRQIEQFTNQCMNDYKLAERDLSNFLNFVRPITDELHLQIQIYGSYAMGLWINQCDIDIMLIPQADYQIQNAVWYLQNITYRLKGSIYQRATTLKNIKIPLIRIQIGEEKDMRKSRKLDISVYSQNNNGRQHVQYVNRFIHTYPKIKPLFLIIKKMTHCYKMYDPAKSGVRSLAIFLMLAIFMQQLPHDGMIGQLLLRFFYKYGYIWDYNYEEDGETMILNLPDPINIKNNVGKKTDAFLLQRMFKTAYLILHTKGVDRRLEYLFDSRQMFVASALPPMNFI